MGQNQQSQWLKQKVVHHPFCFLAVAVSTLLPVAIASSQPWTLACWHRACHWWGRTRHLFSIGITCVQSRTGSIFLEYLVCPSLLGRPWIWQWVSPSPLLGHREIKLFFGNKEMLRHRFHSTFILSCIYWDTWSCNQCWEFPQKNTIWPCWIKASLFRYFCPA